jgi:hypothetical protein
MDRLSINRLSNVFGDDSTTLWEVCPLDGAQTPDTPHIGLIYNRVIVEDVLMCTVVIFNDQFP